MRTILTTMAFLLYTMVYANAGFDMDKKLAGVVQDWTKQECELNGTMDMESKSKAALWSVRCLDGREFMVTIFPNGETGAIACEDLNYIGVYCFVSFRDQEEKL